jgi:hypothetical protein
MIPSLDIRDAIALITGIITVTGAYFAVKGGQKESERLLKALHDRFDDLEKAVVAGQIKHAVLEERVDNLRNTGRFKLARLEAEKAGQSPMFIIEGE